MKHLPINVEHFPAYNAPVDDLDGLIFLRLQQGATKAKHVIFTGDRTIVVGQDARLYTTAARSLFGTFLSYRSNPNSPLFADSMLRGLRKAKIITTAAIKKHKVYMRQCEEGHRRREKIAAFERAAKDLGIQITSAQQKVLKS